MILFSTPSVLKFLTPSIVVWKIKTCEKQIFLTFDDGPVPEVTPYVLDILNKYNAKATFFCLGKNVKNNPELYEQLIKRGHTTGNHSYSHYNGWKTNTLAYIEDIKSCKELVGTTFFRPPYGKIKPSQLNQLKKEYIIVMWSILSCDFDTSLDKEKCLKKLLKNTQQGSIVVFHDSLKAKEKLLYVLPKFLEYYGKRGYSFLSLTDKHFNYKR